MQIKKEQVRDSILKNAELEFYTNGFEKASIRRIVKASGTTIGNFYNYFESKEELFNQIVGEEYYNFKFLLQNHNKLVKPDYLWQISNPSEWKKVLADFIPKFIPQLGNKFVILIECSKGTKYDQAREVLIDLLDEHFKEHLKEHNAKYEMIDIGKVLAEQVLNGIVSIIRQYYNDEKKKNDMIIEYLLFYFIGTMGLLGEF
ncbi:MAG: hypothetical protein CVV02_12950 [Firmicutes bacterium HGW-Firmicutes-7]|nr:MAG: hypothetical protein CVV02_12950 [Firmicutes bacterium HGW-Firmicutes-7]